MKSPPDPALSSRAAFLAAKDEGPMLDSVNGIQVLHFAQADKAVEAAGAQIEVNA